MQEEPETLQNPKLKATTIVLDFALGCSENGPAFPLTLRAAAVCSAAFSPSHLAIGPGRGFRSD